MRAGIDIGGTFTDLAGTSGGGEIVVGKSLNSGRDIKGGIVGALGAVGAELADIGELTHGTTIVTNLLIERSGAKVGLVCTAGFRDVLEIGLSYRERTFDAQYRKPEPLVPRAQRLEIRGRMGPDGHEREPLDHGEIRSVARRLRDMGTESIVVALHNAYVNPAHEREVADICARAVDEVPVTCSTDVDPRIGEFERVSTATLNASAVPRMSQYLEDLRAVMACPTLLMNSCGGAIPPREVARRPIQVALSGPSAGVLAARDVARGLGIVDAIGLDMGGTSADISVIERGEVRQRDSFEVGWGMPARVRSTDIRTIGAGGGSVAWRDAGGALAVGPMSAGALPGPACYGRGGACPTVTDANVILGILSADDFAGGSLQLDVDRAREVIGTLGRSFGVDVLTMARGIHDLVNARMAHAVREMTVGHGIDPRSCVLIAFGGAGGQHAAGVADELGISRIVVPANASVLSATGLLAADVQVSVSQTVLAEVDTLTNGDLDHVWERLARDAEARIADATCESVVFERWGGMRYRDQWHTVPVPLSQPSVAVDRFHLEHERRYGTRLSDPVELDDIWISAIGTRQRVAEPSASLGPQRAKSLGRVRRSPGSLDVLDPTDVPPTGAAGPCLVCERDTVTLVPPKWSVRMESGHLVLEAAP